MRWIKASIVAVLFVSFSLGIAEAADSGEPPKPKRPNILWLVSEDNDPLLGCYGDKFAHTPSLDKLAAEGVQYRNAFANAPVCAASRTTLITGMYGSSLGTLHMRSRYPIPPSVKFFNESLRDAGYYCMNPDKTDYNIRGNDMRSNDKARWDKGNSWHDAPRGKPWMLVLNNNTTHESCLHGSRVHPEYLKKPFTLPPYHPDTPEIRSNWVEYYHQITKMDAQMGSVLAKLQRDGLADDTIVFYYSDHGGILPRSKRFVYDSGLHVPLIVRFGRNFQNLAPAPPGSRLDRLVSFVDLPPSLCSLTGAEIPQQFQGRAFLGPKSAEPCDAVFGFRGRMDETYDLSYTLRDKQYRYIRNYMPHRPCGQHVDYLWKMPATRSWEQAFKAGKCNAAQSAFWLPKPSEELYDELADPYEVKNLADDADHRPVVERMRQAMRQQLLANRDTGFMPESEMVRRTVGTTAREFAQDDARYPLARIIDAADLASRRDREATAKLVELMADPDAVIRYWGATGICIQNQPAAVATFEPLRKLLKDESPAVRVVAAEALCRTGHEKEGLASLVDSVAHSDSLLALNALISLGDIAKSAKDAIAASVPYKKDPYVERASEWLLESLRTK
ncbi:MAG: sulfatase-like hydrolase/transferase [Planctomycetia bacterium]|nr:sulfatase-like hydrolase/transferase [Planctomycetia bacterium]